MNNETDTRRLETAELARLRINFAAFEAARDAACDCDECEPETWHSRLMGRVDAATSWTWGRGLTIVGLVVLVISGGMHLILTALTGGN